MNSKHCCLANVPLPPTENLPRWVSFIGETNTGGKCFQILTMWHKQPLCLLKKPLWALPQCTLKEAITFAKIVQKSPPSSHVKDKPYFGIYSVKRAVTPTIILNICIWKTLTNNLPSSSPNFKTCITHSTMHLIFCVRFHTHSKSNYGSMSDMSKKCQAGSCYCKWSAWRKYITNNFRIPICIKLSVSVQLHREVSLNNSLCIFLKSLKKKSETL